MSAIIRTILLMVVTVANGEDALFLLQKHVAIVENNHTQGSGMQCKCATPNQGTSGKNKYICSGGPEGYCASDQVCYAEGDFTYGDFAAGCATPTCTCETPNTGTAGHNGYTCNDATSAYCASDQVCYATGSFAKGNWQLGCQVTCACDKEGTLHYVEECNSCGVNFCDAALFSSSDPDVEASYSVGTTLPDWGCSHVTSAPTVVQNSATGKIYVVEPTGQILHHVNTCEMCGRNFCAGDYLQDDARLLNSYAVGSDLSTFGCANIPATAAIVRDSGTGAIYVVEPAPAGGYTCTDGTTHSCTAGVQCSAVNPFLASDPEVGCPVGTTTTTQAAMADNDSCASWCSSQKHADQPWIGGKCSWTNCAACTECSR